ncbi:tck1 [Symbiodinium sp. KB8]|nr:tck1 [Symbiodinium sp. KB8]
MTEEQKTSLREDGFLFQRPNETGLVKAGAARNWPQGRGIYYNDTNTALCWCNEEDHCRIISMEDGGNVKSVFARFCQLSDALESSAKANGTKLMFSDRLGFVGSCPTNLGTGLRASVMIRLPEFSKHPALLKAVCKKFKLQPRGSSGEHSQTVDAKWDISNKQRIGFTEVELVQKMIDGVSKVIALEQKLAAGEAIKDGIDF